MRFFRHLVRILLLCIGLVFLISCGRDISRQSLADIESILDSSPDSALALIRQIDTASLRGKAAKAKFSLLHAAALDKNYIDTADTRVVQPAVDYYNRHGSPEERLKAYMYLGTAQYNGGRYNHAIASYNQAAEESIKDLNLTGVLFSKIADAFTMTRDYALASTYIDKSLDCFHSCGRKDQENRELLRKAGNMTQRRKWNQADSCYSILLSDQSLDNSIKRYASLDYAMFLLSLKSSNESKALELLSATLEKGAGFNDYSQLCAYAYLLYSIGREEDAEKVWNQATPRNSVERYNYYYWKHRVSLVLKDYEAAYRDLWSAMSERDSLIERSFELSAADAQRRHNETLKREKDIRIHHQVNQIIIISLLCLVFALIAGLIYMLYRRIRQKHDEENERMNIVIENLKEQLLERSKIDKKRAKFALLADVYEQVYRNNKENEPIEELLHKALLKRIGDLKHSVEAQRDFERMVDNEMDGIMARFRKDCPGLTESEYRAASYYFAGFDNTTVMIIMGISSLENTRTKKKRLKKKLVGQYGKEGEYYSSILSNPS